MNQNSLRSKPTCKWRVFYIPHSIVTGKTSKHFIHIPFLQEIEMLKCMPLNLEKVLNVISKRNTGF